MIFIYELFQKKKHGFSKYEKRISQFLYQSRLYDKEKMPTNTNIDTEKTLPKPYLIHTQ